MSHTPAYTVIQTPEADKLADIRDVSVNKDLPREEGLPSLFGRSETRIISNAADLLSGQVFPRKVPPWRNVCAESFAEIC